MSGRPDFTQVIKNPRAFRSPKLPGGLIANAWEFTTARSMPMKKGAFAIAGVADSLDLTQAGALMLHRYVDTASVGGDGTTPALTGTHAAYARLDTAVSTEFPSTTVGNLVTRNVSYTFHCDASTGLPDGGSGNYFVDLSKIGTNTSAACRLIFQVDLGRRFQKGIWDSTRYRFETSASTNTFSAAPKYTEVYGFQYMFYGDDNNIAFFSSVSGGGGCRVSGNLLCLAPKVAGYTYLGGSGSGAIQLGVDQTVAHYVWNNIIVGWDEAKSGHTTFGVQQTNGLHSYIWNNTFVCTAGAAGNAFTAVIDGYGQLQIKNNLLYSFGNTGAAFTSGSFDTTNSNYNATDLGTATGGSHDLTGLTINMYEPDFWDCRLALTDSAVQGMGVDLSTNGSLPITSDGAGRTRPSTPTIGALEPSVSFPTSSIPTGLLATSFTGDTMVGYASSAAWAASSQYTSVRDTTQMGIDVTNTFESHQTGQLKTTSGGYNYAALQAYNWPAYLTAPMRYGMRFALNLSPGSVAFSLAASERMVLFQIEENSFYNHNPVLVFSIYNNAGTYQYQLYQGWAVGNGSNMMYSQDATITVATVGSERTDGTWREWVFDLDATRLNNRYWALMAVRMWMGPPGTLTRLAPDRRTSTNGSNSLSGTTLPCLGYLDMDDQGAPVTTSNTINLGRWELWDPNVTGDVLGLKVSGLTPPGTLLPMTVVASHMQLQAVNRSGTF